MGYAAMADYNSCDWSALSCLCFLLQVSDATEDCFNKDAMEVSAIFITNPEWKNINTVCMAVVSLSVMRQGVKEVALM